MNQPFKSSEVREMAQKGRGRAAFLRDKGRIKSPEIMERLASIADAYADRLEADEKAVPVAWRKKHLAPDESQIGWILTETRSAHFYCEPLYTHPSSPGAERLAEALRAALEAMHTAGDRDDDGGRPNSATEQIEHAERIALAALAAHSAQAQPPVTSAPGELAEPSKGVLNYEQELSFAEGWNACRKAMLAAQENH